MFLMFSVWGVVIFFSYAFLVSTESIKFSLLVPKAYIFSWSHKNIFFFAIFVLIISEKLISFLFSPNSLYDIINLLMYYFWIAFIPFKRGYFLLDNINVKTVPKFIFHACFEIIFSFLIIISNDELLFILILYIYWERKLKFKFIKI